MSTQLNTNIKIAAPAPIDKRYLSERFSGSNLLPYSASTEVFTVIPIYERYTGLTVNILGVEYWFKNNLTTLVEKTAGGTSIGAVTGATNIGFFSGMTGIQSLPLTNINASAYSGTYDSVYNNYYRGTDGRIHIGTPTDGIPKRGYVKTTTLVKSWIWNEYLGSGNLLGWILIDGNITELIGTFQNGITYYFPTTPYTQTSWTTGNAPNNGSGVIISTITGSLTSGVPITVGGAVYKDKVNSVLRLRTIQTKTPNIISITQDEANIYVSGVTQVTQGVSVGTGTPVFKDLLNNELRFRSIVGSGDTSVSQSGDNIIIYSSGGTGGETTYNLTSPSAIEVGGIKANTVLTGKTSFQLFEELLVPELFQTSVGTPTTTVSLTATGTYEVGSIISETVIPTYNAGAITPQYLSTGGFRGGAANAYSYSGPSLTAGFVGSISCSISSYVVTSGVQTWSVCTRYDAGAIVMGSKGTVNPSYPTACPLNSITNIGSASITGLYPYYYGKLTSGSRPAVTNALVTGGTKQVLPSTSTVTVTFNSGSSDYTWLAIPAASPSRQSWYISVSNKGSVNTSPLDKYPDECLITINSECWTGIQYKVYMSKTIGTNTTPIEFRTTPNI